MKKGLKALLFAAIISVCVLGTSNSAWADSVTVIESSVYIRSTASTTGKILGGAMQNEVLETLGTETDESGKVWYKVKMNDGTVGYVREDLVSTKGPAAPAKEEEPKKEDPAPETPAAPVSEDVTEVEPAAATVTGGVNVRKGPSTSTDLVAQAAANTAVTVNGYVNTGSELWYLLTYSTDSSEVTGYIRSDFIKLSGELTEKKAEEPAPAAPEDPAPTEEPEEEEKVYTDYAAVYENDDEGTPSWFLYDYTTGTKHKISTLLNTKDELSKVKTEAEKKNRNKTIIIFLILIFDALIFGAIAYLYLKYRSDNDGYNDTEESVRNSKPRTTQAPRTSATHSASAEKRTAAGTVRTSAVSHPTVNRNPINTSSPATDSTPAVRSISSVSIPKGSVDLGDGRYRTPDGKIVKTLKVKGKRLPDGSLLLPDGRIRKPDGTIVSANTAGTVNRSAAHSADDDMELGFLNMDSSSSDKR